MTALIPSRPDRPFHGLWSLLDVLKFNASAFFKATMCVQHTLTAIENKKSRIEESGGGVRIQFVSDPVVIQFLHKEAADLREHVITLGAKLTLLESDRIIGYLEEGRITYEDVTKYLNNLCSRLADELSLKKMFLMEAEKEQYFEPAAPLFGAIFETKFQTAAAELDEAAKCLALGRSTACVFHLMRLMEHALRAVAACLGIPPISSGGDRSWGKILGSIRTAMDDKAKRHAWLNAADKELFAEIHASLDAVRIAWRNSTMHVENTYSDDQAEHVFVAVRGFMKMLSDRLDENGDPKA